jgi:hypothetical protein
VPHDRPATCSYCGKSQLDVRHLVVFSRSGAAICDLCIRVVATLVATGIAERLDVPRGPTANPAARLISSVARLADAAWVLEGWDSDAAVYREVRPEERERLRQTLAEMLQEIEQSAEVLMQGLRQEKSQ